MQLINNITSTWKRPLVLKHRFQFFGVLMLLGLGWIYFQLRDTGFDFGEYIPVVVLILLSGFVTMFFPLLGNTILRLWLTVAGLIGQIIFFIVLSICYFVILLPFFGLKNLVRNKSKEVETGWKKSFKTNKDFANPG